MHRRTSDHRIRSSLASGRLFLLGALSLTVGLGATGCQSSPKADSTSACKPQAGMTTDKLFDCNCFPANEGGGFALSPQEGVAAQSIVILNYFCPKRGGGMSRVMVVNGVAKDVYE